MSPIDPKQLKIVYYPHPTLVRKAQPVPEVNDEVRAVANRMIELMHEAKGVGLAAPQVALSWRMFVTNSGQQENEPDRVYINPVLKDPGGELETREEGCLSIPDVYGDVIRPTEITIEATDLEGNRFEMRTSEFLARVWQHEYDHIEGRLILSRFGQMAKLSNRKILKQLEEAARL